MSGVSGTGPGAARAVGWLAVVSTAVYFLSDMLEASHGGFTSARLWLTLASETALPAVVVGPHRAHGPCLPRTGRCDAGACSAHWARPGKAGSR